MYPCCLAGSGVRYRKSPAVKGSMELSGAVALLSVLIILMDYVCGYVFQNSLYYMRRLFSNKAI